MLRRGVRLLIALVLTTPTLSRGMTARAPQVSESASTAAICTSRSLVSLRSARGDEWGYVVSGTQDRLLFHLDGHATLIIPAEGDAFVESRAAPYARIDRPLTARENEIVAELRAAAGTPGVGALIRACRALPERDTRIPLAFPLETREKKACADMATELRELRSCFEQGDCRAMEEKYFDGDRRRAPRDFSFRKLVETGSGDVPIKMVALGAASAASWTWDFTVVRSIVQNRASLALTFGRTGVLIGGAGAAAMSFLFVPATAFVFGRDSCRAGPALDNEGIDYADCLGKTAVQLTPVLRRQVEQALQSPDAFAASLNDEKRAVESRLSCMLVETLIASYEERRAQVRCQGRTIDIGPDLSYIQAPGGELIRHQDGYYSHHFHPGRGTWRAVKRAQGIPDLRMTAKLKEELEMLKILAPRIADVSARCP